MKKLILILIMATTIQANERFCELQKEFYPYKENIRFVYSFKIKYLNNLLGYFDFENKDKIMEEAALTQANYLEFYNELNKGCGGFKTLDYTKKRRKFNNIKKRYNYLKKHSELLEEFSEETETSKKDLVDYKFIVDNKKIYFDDTTIQRMINQTMRRKDLRKLEIKYNENNLNDFNFLKKTIKDLKYLNNEFAPLFKAKLKEEFEKRLEEDFIEKDYEDINYKQGYQRANNIGIINDNSRYRNKNISLNGEAVQVQELFKIQKELNSLERQIDYNLKYLNEYRYVYEGKTYLNKNYYEGEESLFQKTKQLIHEHETILNGKYAEQWNKI